MARVMGLIKIGMSFRKEVFFVLLMITIVSQIVSSANVDRQPGSG